MEDNIQKTLIQNPIEHCLQKVLNPKIIPKRITHMKYLVVCGSTISGVGKGSTMSGLGALLKACGLHVTCIKIDPYLNVDAGLMSPYEHGEVFVLDDGGESDLDWGNYERALGVKLTRNHNITSGKVFQEVINSERKGEYLGKTVQMIPHVCDKIKSMINYAAHIPVERDNGYDGWADICLIEWGGTVGDIESTLFFEAIRQLSNEVGEENIATIMITYIPETGGENEQKSKPTQNGIRELKAMGVFPSFYICRSNHPWEDYVKKKIAFFANVPDNCVFTCYNVNSIYEIPIWLASQHIHFHIINQLQLPLREYNLMKWIGLPLHINSLNIKTQVRIALCGKYIYTADTYYSVLKSWQDATISANRKWIMEWIDCSILDKEEAKNYDEKEKEKKIKELWAKLETCDGILVPGGFGKRGAWGMIEICRYARENLIPYLGICLGMQIAVIEFCRNVLNIQDANSWEFDENCKSDVITTMEDTDYVKLGGTLRLGAQKCIIKDENSWAYKIYGKNEIIERHRHRFEVNPKYVEQIEKKGMIFSGKDKNSQRMEIIEIPTHPFFFASQFHPEYKTFPFNP
ncbi:MAG: glutamine hydrolyzing CTP synthase, partial [Mycoplasma sp.]